MCSEKLIDFLGLVRREIVCNHMDLFALRLVRDEIRQKCHKLGRGVAFSRLAEDIAGLGIEGCVQRQRAMTVVLEAMAFGATQRAAEPDPCGERWIAVFRRRRTPPRAAVITGLAPMTSAAFASKFGRSRRLPSSRSGLSPCRGQIRATVICEIVRSSEASLRDDQCVEPSDVSRLVVQAKTLTSIWSVTR